MSYNYLIAFQYQGEKKEGFGHATLSADRSLKTKLGIIKIQEIMEKHYGGGNIVILNIIELDAE